MEECSKNTLAVVRQKLLTPQGVLLSSFVSFMRPEFQITSTRINIVDQDSCGDPTVPTVTPPPNPPVPPIPECGYYKYTIPANLFTDSGNRNTRSFYLNLTNSDGKELSENSIIRFNRTQQFVYSIVSWSTALKQYLFNLKAIHPETGQIQTVKLTVTLDNFDIMAQNKNTLCWFQTILTYTYNILIDDVTLLKYFIETLSKYLQMNIELQIYSYTRYTLHQQNYFLVYWTDCNATRFHQTATSLFQYYTKLNSIQAKLFNKDQTGNLTTTLNNNLMQYFQSNSKFIIKSIITENCTKPSNPPPRARYTWKLDLECGYFEYRIPDDLFIISDGNIRDMSVTLVEDESVKGMQTEAIMKWLMLNTTKYVNGIVSNSTIKEASNGEYKFTIVLKDFQGRTAKAPLIVKVPKAPLKPSQSATEFIIDLLGVTEVKSQLEYELLVLRNVKSLFRNILLLNESLTLAQETTFIPAFQVYIHVTNCYTCYETTSTSFDLLLQYIVNFESVPVNQKYMSFVNSLRSQGISPSKNTLNVATYNCTNIQSPYRPVPITIPYCTFWRYDLRVTESPAVTQLEVLFGDANGDPLEPNSWIWINDYVIEAFPPSYIWNTPTPYQENFTYSFYYESEPLGLATLLVLTFLKGECNFHCKN